VLTNLQTKKAKANVKATNVTMKFLAITLSFLLSNVAHATSLMDWESLSIMDHLVLEHDTSMDHETVLELDTKLYNCHEGADNHGEFVRCGKRALQSHKDDLFQQDYQILKTAILESDFGKSAAEIMLDETSVKLDTADAKELDGCEANAESLEGYKACMHKALKKLVIKGLLLRKEANLIRQAIEDMVEVYEGDEDDEQSEQR
jgi:hypothetical protein